MGMLFFDQYSLLHFSSGVVAYFWGIDFNTWMILHFLFEILENTKKGMKAIRKISIWPGGKSFADSCINSFGDQIFAMMGWYVSYKLDKVGSENQWYEAHI